MDGVTRALSDAAQLGVDYERSLSPEQRRRTGAFYTPEPLATALAEATLKGLDTPVTVCDPAVGCGSLLLAAARTLKHNLRVVGVDTDPHAVKIAKTSLDMIGVDSSEIVVGDALDRRSWPEIDVVLTNPPFLNQLRTATRRVHADKWGDAGKGYADVANLFLLLSLDLVRPGGRIGIVLPEPIVSARDAAPTRVRIGNCTQLNSLWRESTAFDAGVRVCLAVMQKATPKPGPWQRGDWGQVASRGVPSVDLKSNATIGDRANVTADFRDQFYGVAAVTAEDATPPVVTCGLIDPLRIRWGERTARIGGRVYERPGAALEHATKSIQRWASTRLVPKLMVATQTRVLEAAIDPHGKWLPMVPIITVVPEDPADLWLLAAALNSPPLTAHAHRAHTGAALSPDAIKLSARQLAALPLPTNQDAWSRAAGHARQNDLIRMGEAMCDAYGVPGDELMAWWVPRLPKHR